MHILVIDDDPHVRIFLRLLLESEGYRVTEAVNGADGLIKYKNDPAVIIITDIVMPEQEGMETIYKLKKENPEVKIIAISGGGRNQPGVYLSLSKKLGAAFALEKPIAKNELLEVIRQLAQH